MSEPRRLEIGRPDFVVKSGLLPVGYVEAEAYGRDLDALTGHAKTQNERFIENLDNFISPILSNFSCTRKANCVRRHELRTKVRFP